MVVFSSTYSHFFSNTFNHPTVITITAAVKTLTSGLLHCYILSVKTRANWSRGFPSGAGLFRNVLMWEFCTLENRLLDVAKICTAVSLALLRSCRFSFPHLSLNVFLPNFPWYNACCTRVGTLIVATIYLQMIQNRYMFRSFTVLQCSHQHCVQPVASDVEVVGYL